MAVSTKVNRRSFFDRLFSASNDYAVNSLDEYTTPLTELDVYHLLKRCCFSVDIAYAKTLIGKKAKEVVTELVNNAAALNIPLPDFDVNQGFRNPNLLPQAQYADERYFNLTTHFTQNELLIEWWVKLMRSDKKSLSEKMTFFWHSHFTSQYDGGEPIPAQWMYKQNILFRSLYMSQFKTFLEKITIDGAMLQYLNGSQNIKDAPNENYARELLELFSVGIGDGNYTEEDIREGARILTGWQVSHFIEDNRLYKPFFNPSLFDESSKKVFDEIFYVDYEITEANVYANSIQKYMDVILKKRGDQVANFMASKFYRYFVYNKSVTQDNPMVKELGIFFKASGFDVKATIIKLLSSQHFFDPNTKGIMIKSPLENLLGFAGQFNIPDSEIGTSLKGYGQEPFNPPNVSGWKGYRTWITTKTLPAYIESFTKTINSKPDQEIGLWAAHFEGFSTSYDLVEDICLLFCGRIPIEDRVKKLENVLLGGAPYYEWPELAQNTENAGLRVKALLKELFKMPEFYLA